MIHHAFISNHALIPHKMTSIPIYYNLYNNVEEKKIRITKKNEPKDYFLTNLDKKSDGDKCKDPLVILGLFSIFSPFLLFCFFYSIGLITF